MVTRNSIRSRGGLFASLFCAVLLAGCATGPPPGDADAKASYDEANDPLEPMNRGLFEVYQFTDDIAIKPLALMYHLLVPPEPRRGVRNFLSNLRAPVNLANDLLQGKIDRAYVTAQRFALNSTLGIAGVMDVANDYFDIKGHKEDFGQTLAVWGSVDGPYIMLPLLGPTSPRDLVGLVVDSLLDPLGYFVASEALIGRTFARGIDERERVIDALDEIERTSLDFYATFRSLYRQRRADEIRDGEPAPAVPVPTFVIDEFEEPDSERVTLVN